MMNHIMGLLVILFATSCGSSLLSSSYTNWDANSNRSLDRYEFVDGYTQSNFFNKWSSDQNAIRYEDLYEGVFKSIDTNNDNNLSEREFRSKIGYFYFGMFNGEFNEWDQNSNSLLSQREFYSSVCKTNLANIWDTTDDNRISEREFAGGMFYISDLNSDGRVDQTEFTIWRADRERL